MGTQLEHIADTWKPEYDAEAMTVKDIIDDLKKTDFFQKFSDFFTLYFGENGLASVDHQAATAPVEGGNTPPVEGDNTAPVEGDNSTPTEGGQAGPDLSRLDAIIKWISTNTELEIKARMAQQEQTGAPSEEVPAEQPAVTPGEQPTETPTEQPVETPTEQPVETPTE
jgi:hypothetical protein